MGHIHLGTIPRSRLWQNVVSLLDDGAGTEDIANASATAAEKTLLGASGNAVYIEAVRLLVNIPLAAKQADFGNALRLIDVQVGSNPSLIEVVSAANRRLEAVAYGQPGRTDFSDISMRAFSQAIAECIGGDLPGLFGASPEDLRQSFRKFSRDAGMSEICRSFFGGIVSSSLSYWLDRILNDHIGDRKAFMTIADRTAFDTTLRAYVGESTRIIKEFAAGWVGKMAYQTGEITTPEARIFGHVSLKKVVEELRLRRGQDA